MAASTIPVDDDWQSKKSLSQALWYMYKQQLGCDVIFEVGSSLERIGAHATILMSRSQIFFSEFAQGLPEREIVLTEAQPEEFEVFMKYLYTGTLNMVDVSPDPVIKLAEKYHLYELERQLMSCQLEKMKVDDFCPFVRKFEREMTDVIKFNCLEYVFKQPGKVFKSNTFTVLPASFLKELLSHEYLVLEEDIICTAVLLWASKACELQKLEVTGANQRLVLGEILFEIRFPLLSSNYFTEHISEKGLLSSSEEVQIFKSFFNPNKKKDATITFNSNPRKAPAAPFKYGTSVPGSTADMLRHQNSSLVSVPSLPILHTLASGDERTIMRFTERGSGWGYRTNRKDAIAFTCSKNIRLVSVYIYGNCNHDGVMDVTLAIMKDEKQLTTTEVQVHCKKSKPNYEINVENTSGSYGINIPANEEYHIVLSINGDNGYYGKGGKPKCSENGVEFEFRSSKLSTNNTTVGIGQIAGFKFTLV